MIRILLVISGTISLAVGIAGIVLPLVPTTPLLLLAGYCFAKSSPRFEKWLKGTKVYQFYVADYAETKSISRERKKKIIVQIYILMGISIWFAPLLPIKIFLFFMTIFITYQIFKVIPDKE
ncbi:YbaN family protein [Streptococcus caprae]|uniref:YbaN family protein n=1 Tax=Streptococcus caprae TaxID=1640501 RepID=A0ABV8CY62_9STRE